MILILGWSVFAYLVNRVRNAESDTKVYNPYDILGISPVRASPVQHVTLIPSFLGCLRKGNKITL